MYSDLSHHCAGVQFLQTQSMGEYMGGKVFSARHTMIDGCFVDLSMYALTCKLRIVYIAGSQKQQPRSVTGSYEVNALS